MSSDDTQRGPAVGYRVEPCPECSAEVIVTWQGYRVNPEPVKPAIGNCALMVLPGGQVLLAGAGNPDDNRYEMHDHQPEGLE